MANREDTLATFRRVRAIQAVDELQKQSVGATVCHLRLVFLMP